MDFDQDDVSDILISLNTNLSGADTLNDHQFFF